MNAILIYMTWSTRNIYFQQFFYSFNFFLINLNDFIRIEVKSLENQFCFNIEFGKKYQVFF